MSEVFETRCHVWDVDFQTPEDESFPCATFIIHIQATFTTAASYEDEEVEDHEPCFIEPQTESVVLEKTYEVQVQSLMHNNNSNISSNVRVRDMLLSMDIPVQDFMVEQILACAHRMGSTDQHYRNRKVLRMRVEIEAVVDELPDQADDDEEHSNSMMNDNESETTALVEKLRKVRVESPNSCCPICFEDFLVGMEATSMPACSHLFHPRCIIPWLYKKKVCPLCRSELN
ncbi:hypothetical protein REPUB_Repub10bG0081600 [Reevesia pubescens]